MVAFCYNCIDDKAMENDGIKDVGKAVRAIRESRGWSMDVLAAKTGKPKNTIANWETGKTKPHGGTIAAVLRVFQFSTVEELLIHANQMRRTRLAPPGEKGLPILSKVPGGNGDFDPQNEGFDNGFAPEYFSRLTSLGVDDPDAYCLRVVGDSMMPEYPEGSLVVCSPAAKKDAGRVFAIRFGSELGDECTLKKVIEIDEMSLLLQPLNESHKPRVVARAHIVRMDRVVYVIKGV